MAEILGESKVTFLLFVVGESLDSIVTSSSFTHCHCRGGIARASSEDLSQWMVSRTERNGWRNSVSGDGHSDTSDSFVASLASPPLSIDYRGSTAIEED